MPTIQHVGRQAVQPAIKREPESARGRKHGITEATDIPLTVPLSATEKGTLSHRKPPMTADAARPQSWGVARLSFGMPKNVGRAAIAPEKPRSTLKGEKITKLQPRGRPQVSTLKRLTKSVTVKFSKPDYEKLRHRSKNANRTLAEYIRDAAFEARIVAKHSAEDAAVIRNLTGMANNLNQLTKLSHQTGFYRTKNIVMEVLEKLKSIMSDYKAEERRCR